MMGDVISLDSRRGVVVNGCVTYAYAVGATGGVPHLQRGAGTACSSVRHRRLRTFGTIRPDAALADPFLCEHCKAALRRELA